MQKKVTLSIDSKTYDEFRKYCKENAIMLSKKIEIWIKNSLNEAKIKEKSGEKGGK
jgi:hypothetical protein